jgi:excinuclease ABC subunit A
MRKISQNETFYLFPVGFITREKKRTYLSILRPFHPALKDMEPFSHLLVFWSFSELSGDEDRKTLRVQPRSPKAPKSGVFACRSPRRPNPIGLTIVKIVEVDHTSGCVEIVNIDAMNNTPIVGIRPYLPDEDRVKSPVTPDWVSDSKWVPEEGSTLKEGERSREASVVPDTEKFSVTRVGVVKKERGKIRLEIDEPFVPALKNLNTFSHLRLLWFVDRFLDDNSRRTAQLTAPFDGRSSSGVFACRGIIRANPIGVTTLRIDQIDEKNGRIEIIGGNLLPDLPIIDIKPYIPSCDRVKNPNVLNDLPNSRQWTSE